MNLLGLFKRKRDPHERARNLFNQCFGHYDAPIQAAKADHARSSDHLLAKREALHAALRGGGR